MQVFKMYKVLFVLYIVMILVDCDNAKKAGSRHGRFFTFNMKDEDIKIDLDFSIPFLNIPVKRTMNSVNGLMDFPSININPASLALGGAVVLGTTVLIPFLLKNYAHDNYKYAKILNNAEFSTDAVMDFASQMLSDGRGFQGCSMRIACWAAQQEYTNPQEILNQIVNNRLLSSMVNSSAVEDAMISGRHGRSCSSYGPCPLQEHHVPMLMRNLASLATEPGLD